MPTVPRVLTLVAAMLLVGLVVARGIGGGREDATLHAVEGGHSVLLLVTGADRPFELAGATVVPPEVAPLHAAVVPVEGTPECVAFTLMDPRTGGLGDVTIHRIRVHRGGSGAESVEISESASAACLPLASAEDA